MDTTTIDDILSDARHYAKLAANSQRSDRALSAQIAQACAMTAMAMDYHRYVEAWLSESATLEMMETDAGQCVECGRTSDLRGQSPYLLAMRNDHTEYWVCRECLSRAVRQS